MIISDKASVYVIKWCKQNQQCLFDPRQVYNPMQQSQLKSRAKSLFSGWRDPNQRRRELYQHSVREHKKLYQKISYLDPTDQPPRHKYSTDTLTPYLYFYKLLAKKQCPQTPIPPHHRLKLNLPDTIVYNDGDLPVMWFYTDSRDGLVYRVDGVGSRQILAKMCERAEEDEVVALLKKPGYGAEGLEGNDVKMVTCGELKEGITNIGATRGEINVLQRYVKCNSVKPFIVRVAWHKQKNPQFWIITSNYQYNNKDPTIPQQYKYATVPKVRKACSVFRSTKSGFLKQTIGYINNLRSYLLRELEVTFEEFVGDFVKDEGGNWWFVNVRAFILSRPDEKVNVKQITMYGDYEQTVNRKSAEKKTIDQYQKCKNCKYCNKIFPQHLMTHKLTLIMLLQADKHLLARGKTFPWLQRCFSQHIGNVNLYIEHKVCDSCYTFYKEIEKLMRLQIQFARLLGVAVPQDNKNNVSITGLPAFKGQSPQFGSRLQKNTYQQTMPINWGLPAGQNIQMQNSIGGKGTTNKYRLMFLIHSVRDIPAECHRSNYSLQYNIFQTRIRYALNMSDATILDNKMLEVNVNKIRVFFFFAPDRKILNQFIKEQQTLKLNLLQDGQKIGELELELNDFLSEKVIKREYYKMFSGKTIMPLLSWGVNITLGLHDSGVMDKSNLKIHEYRGLYLHDNKDYYTCDPLPQQWVNLIAQKQRISRPLKTEPQLSDVVMSEQSFKVDKGSNHSNLAESAVVQGETPNDLNREIMQYSRRRTHSSRIKKRIYY